MISDNLVVKAVAFCSLFVFKGLFESVISFINKGTKEDIRKGSNRTETVN